MVVSKPLHVSFVSANYSFISDHGNNVPDLCVCQFSVNIMNACKPQYDVNIKSTSLEMRVVCGLLLHNLWVQWSSRRVSDAHHRGHRVVTHPDTIASNLEQVADNCVLRSTQLPILSGTVNE